MSLLADRVLDACQRHPTRLGLIDAHERMDYGRLRHVAEDIAGHLARYGLHGSEPVLVPVSNTGRDLAAFLGVWLAGGVAVPVHRDAAEATAVSLLATTGARLVANGRPELATPPALASPEIVTCQDRPAPAARSLLEGAALIVFSSGTTGEPKGVVVGHERFSGKLDMINSVLEFEDGTRSLLVLQLTFSFGQWVALLTLIRGGTLQVESRFRPDPVLRALASGGIDRAAFVPTMLRDLLNADGAREADWSGHVMAGGEVMPAALADEIRATWPEAKLWDIFGLTETGTSDFFVRPAEYDQAAGSIGRPGPGVEFRLAGPDGELQIKTPYGMLGYLDAPELTAAAYADGWFRTGDLARLRGDGRVELVGRSKEQIVRGGNKISPLEVERAFLAHASVAQALATGIADERAGEAVHLLVVPVPAGAPEPAALLAWAEGRLDRYKMPAGIHIAKELPLGHTGKADRRELRRLIEAGEI